MENALQQQRLHYEEVAEKTKHTRDRIEKERLHVLKVNLIHEKEEALKAQWETAERSVLHFMYVVKREF